MSLALLVPGGTGQLGRELVERAPAGADVHAPGSAELDVTNAGAVVEAVKTFAAAAQAAELPAVVVNAAAYTGVDAAEAEPAKAFAVNGDGPRVLAAACSAHGLPLIHVSTDYVFAGDARSPYRTEEPVAPRSVYGATKAAGEDGVLRSGARAWVVRTAWVYGAYGANFVKTMAKLASGNDPVSVVDDQHGSPTWTGDLAEGLLELAGRVTAGNAPAARVLHATGAGETTWYGFARAVFAELGHDPDRVKPCTSAEFPRPAPRPAYSVLSDEEWRAAGLTPLRPWQEALTAALAEAPAAYRP
jgi:dTDP-4-dehydrorhamnose reductase